MTDDNTYLTPGEAAAFMAGRDANPPSEAELERAAKVLGFVGRCATCRWAEPHDLSFHEGIVPLVCTRIDGGSRDAYDGQTAFVFALDAADSAFVVSPDFGCVMYEPRDSQP